MVNKEFLIVNLKLFVERKANLHTFFYHTLSISFLKDTYLIMVFGLQDIRMVPVDFFYTSNKFGDNNDG
ncbi:MAG: hypothetical protein D8M57_09265 [Candidatus Scalindua sp. AMX11]|nr:MAG: hypothetical protein DWQ00_00505 [Candidatus Scalindua sp.]TDE65219.1 MAG: hypothetical protein D8M57_09265 [Candidatus Scalindua sp. AMX11]GJQ58544.1 MAG: hypothetical protein SCALA701_13450 [Candidatus Scalindua sp.]